MLNVDAYLFDTNCCAGKSIGGFLLLTEPLPDNIKMDDMHEFLCRVLCVKVHIDVFFSRMQFPELNYEHSHCVCIFGDVDDRERGTEEGK